MNLHNLLHYIQLRIDSHAQREIREYANAFLQLITPIVPNTIEAFRRYKMDSITFSRDEILALRENRTEVRTKRETKEFQDKLKQITPELE